MSFRNRLGSVLRECARLVPIRPGSPLLIVGGLLLAVASGAQAVWHLQT